MNPCLVSILGQQPAISTLVTNRPVHLTAAEAHCIPCEDSVNDTTSEGHRLSSTYTRCGDAINPIDDTFGNTHSAYILNIV